MNSLAHEAAAPERRVDAHRNAHQQGQRGRHDGQLEGGRKALAQQARDLLSLAQAQAELALRGIDQEVPELHEEGLVQPQVGAQLANLLGLASCPSRNTTGSPTY
jgi:hypothetical protein